MSPTLLEGVIILILLLLGWQIGIQLAPRFLRYWGAAQRQLDQIAQADDPHRPQPPTVEPLGSLPKESTDGQATRPQ